MTDLLTMPTAEAALPSVQSSSTGGAKTRSTPDAPQLGSRVIGIVGAIALFLGGVSQMFGLHFSSLLRMFAQWPAMLIIAALALFGLMASHGPRMVGRLFAVACGWLAHNDAEAQHLRRMCRHGRRLSYSGGVLALLMGLIHVMSVLDQPELIGPFIAVALMGLVLAILIAELGFGAVKHWVRT